MNPIVLAMLATMGPAALLSVISKVQQSQKPLLDPRGQAKPTASPTPSPASALGSNVNTIAGYTNGTIPSDAVALINKYAAISGIHPALLAASQMQESGFNNNANGYSPITLGNGTTMASHDRGRAQISDYWHPEVTDAQAFDPDFATKWQAAQLAKLISNSGSTARGVASYNVGGSRVGAGTGRDANGLGPKGRDYVGKVNRNLAPNIIQLLGLGNT